MTEAPLTSIVVIGYNSPEWLARCLRSLSGSGRPRHAFEVIVVDNASDPPLADALEGRLDGVRLLTLDRNVGFGRACNLARRFARGRRLLLLNPDTEVRPGAVDALADLLEREPWRGLVGGRTLGLDGRVDPRSCLGQPSLWSQLCFALGLSTVFARSAVFDPESLGRWQRDSLRTVGAVTGCLLMVSTEVWDELEGFDPDFFMYGEDVDLARRAIAHGYRPSMTPAAAVVHAWGASSPSADRHVMVLRGKVTIARKKYGAIGYAVSRILLLTGALLRRSAERFLRRRGPWASAWSRRSEWLAGWPPLDRAGSAASDLAALVPAPARPPRGQGETESSEPFRSSA